jgi:hypothetical protein
VAVGGGATSTAGAAATRASAGSAVSAGVSGSEVASGSSCFWLKEREGDTGKGLNQLTFSKDGIDLGPADNRIFSDKRVIPRRPKVAGNALRRGETEEGLKQRVHVLEAQEVRTGLD